MKKYLDRSPSVTIGLILGALLFLFLVLPTSAQAGITFVGSCSANGNNGANATLPLPSAQENDLVIVAYQNGDDDNGDKNLVMVTAGYTEVADIFSDDSFETNLGVFWKFMGSTPDTDAVADNISGNDSDTPAVCMVFRGVDTSTPMDVTPTTASGANQGTFVPNPPSINHNNPAGVWTVIAGANAHNLAAANTFTFPTGYTTDAIQIGGDDTVDGSVGLGYRSSGVSDPEDPGTMTYSGTDAATHSWAAATIALRPAAIVAPTVTTQSASSVGETTATLNGNITATGGANATARGFAWGTSATMNGDTATTTESGSFGTGAFTDTSITFVCNTTYYSRAYATNSSGTGYGAISASFTTSACPAAPTVTTQSASSVGETTATLNGNITATGGANATARGFAWGTSATMNGDTATTTESGSFGTGAFTDTSITFVCNTTYYSRAYATNSSGTGYGAISASFTTSACPAPQAPTVSGTLYSDRGVTPLTTGGLTIRLAIGTSTPGVFSTTTCSGCGGAWRITGLPSWFQGESLVVFIDGGSTLASTFTKASTTESDIRGLDLFQNRVIVKHEGFTATTTRNNDLNFYDGDNDTDIQFRVDGSNNLSVNKGQELYIAPGTYFAPGGSVTLHGNAAASPDGDFHLATGARQDGVATSSIANFGANELTLAGNFFASSTSIFSQSSSATTTFNATTTGKVIIASSSPFSKVKFTGGGSWTVSSDVTVSSANAVDTLVIGNGTVTLGDGTTGINVEVNGKVVIAGTAGETGTLQTAALTQGATTTVDINDNASPATCANCIIQVGATSGGGQGNLKIRKNTVLRLNPASAGSDTGIEVESTGYLEVEGSQEDADAVSSIAETTSNSTVTVSGTPWSVDQFNNMTVRVTNAASLAFGRVYDITDTTASTIIIAATTSPQDTSPTISGGACTGNATCDVNVADSLVAVSGDHTGRYLHNVTDNTYYRIATTSEAAQDFIRIITNTPDDFTTMNSNDDVEVTDGIKAGDSFEILDYAHITAEAGTNCTATLNQSYEAYIYAKTGSESLIRYGDICDLGRGATNRFGSQFSVDGANANEGVTIDTSRFRHNYRAIMFINATGNTGTKGILDSFITGSLGSGIYLNASATNTVATTHILNGNSGGISMDTEVNGNTVHSNYVYGNVGSGISCSTQCTNNTLSSNVAYKNGAIGIFLLGTATDNNVLLSNTVHTNGFIDTTYGLFLNDANNTTVASTTAYSNRKSGIVNSESQHNTIFNSRSYSNGFHGMTEVCTQDTNTLLFNNSYYSNTLSGLMNENEGDCVVTGINESYGVLGSNNVGGDVYLGTATANPPGNHKLTFYNSTFSSTLISEVNTSEMVENGTRDWYVISRKHDGNTASTTIWGDYSVRSENTETPQVESTDKFNYADNLWEKSARYHGYRGTGSEDSDLDYDLSTADLSGGPYHYRLTATSSAACTSALKFDVFRNTTAVGVASCGVAFTDSNGGVNVIFTIDGGTPTMYVAGDSYTFTVWDAANSTNVQKKIALVTHNGEGGVMTSTTTVPFGMTLELKGQSAGTNVTQITREGSSSGYQFRVAGTLDASNYSFNYGGGTGQNSTLELYSSATITSINDGSFDNFAVNNGTDSFITLHSSLIGAGAPSKVWDGLSFVNTGGNANCNVNATSTDATGFWEFTNYTGAFAGETNDCNDGAADSDPGQIKWTAVVNITVSGTIYSDEGQTPLNAAGKTVMLRVGTSTPGFFATTTVAGTGAWRIDNLKSMSTDAIVSVWIDNDATFRAFSLTKASSTSNIPNLDLYQNRLIVKREGTSVASTTITDLAAYDGDNDADIQFSANGGALNVSKDQELHIWAGNPFVPGGAVTVHGNASSGTDGSLHLDDNAAYVAGGVTTLAGSWAADTGSVFTSNGYEVVFNATTTGKTIAGTLTGANAFATTTFNGSGGGWTFSNNASTTGLTITASALTAPSLLSIAGQYANNAGANGFTHNSGTMYFTGTSTTLSGTMTGNSAFNHVIFRGPVIASTPAAPASTASTTPSGNCVNDTSIGTVAWDALDCDLDDGSYAEMGSPANNNAITYYLMATNFGLSVPTDATIDGILVDVERQSNDQVADVVSDYRVRIVKDGAIGETDRAKAGFWGFTANVVTTYGSPTDTWGETWTPSDINSSDFGFAIAATIGDPAGAARVDMIRIKVHYTTAGISGTTGGVWSFGANASTTNFTIANGTTTAPSGLLSIAGNYTNSGGFTHNSGMVYLSGTTTQTVAGNLTSPSAFYNLEIVNTSGTGDDTQSVIFGNAVSASSTFSMLPSTSAQFLAGATTTFQNIDWNGVAAGTRVWLRSSSVGSSWGLKVPGTRVASYVNVRDSNACSNEAHIEAAISVDTGGNTCWTFQAGVTVTGGGRSGGSSIEDSGSGPPVEGGAPAGGEAPEEGGAPPPPVEGGTPGGGGGGDVGYRGGTNNLAAVFASDSLERILRAVIKAIGSFFG